MKVITTEFVTGAVSVKQYPKEFYPEFAFVGRSNVGKSSLIRSLLNRKKLVRISSTPGKTREINFFRINEMLMFADLPGYGFARVTPALQNKWKIMIEEYNSQNIPLSVPNEYLINDTSRRVLNLIVGTAKLSNSWSGIY